MMLLRLISQLLNQASSLSPYKMLTLFVANRSVQQPLLLLAESFSPNNRHTIKGYSPSELQPLLCIAVILVLSLSNARHIILAPFLAHSIGMSLCNREASVVCLSVCKLIHASRYFYHKHDLIATKLAHDGPHRDLDPGCAQGQGQRSRDTDTFVISRKSLLLSQT